MPTHDAASPRPPLGRQVSRDLRHLTLDAHRYVQAVGREMGIPTTDVHAVGVLHGAPDSPSATELGQALGLTPSATSSLIDRLEHAEHAVRATAPEDSRRARIVVTDGARAESRARFAAMNEAIDAALAAAGPHDAEVFARVLTDLAARVSESTRDRTTS